MVATAECDLTGSQYVHFSSSEYIDKITTSISGETCTLAKAVTRITDSHQNIVYEYKFDLSDGFRDEITKEDGLRVIRLHNRVEMFESTKDLPKWESPDSYYDKYSQEISLPKDEYELLQTKNWITYSHQVGYEGYKTVVYDRDNNLVKEVTSGSP